MSDPLVCGDKSNTPRTDAEAFDGGGSGLNTPNPQGMLVRADVARQLERELAFRNRQYDDLWADIQRERAIPSSKASLSPQTLTEAEESLELADKFDAALGDATILSLVRQHRETIARALRSTIAVSARSLQTSETARG